MRKYLNFLIIPLLLNYLFSSLVFSADRADVSGITVTITTDCSELDIGGDGSNVTVNSGVTIDAEKGAVVTGNATNA